ncbi:Nucleolar protein 9 [Bienertia sinuspersici]
MWKFTKWTDEYKQGTDRYIEKNFSIKSQGNRIRCLCNSFHYRYWPYQNIVKDHIICNDFVPRTEDFLEKGKGMGSDREREVHEQNETLNMNDEIEGLLHDTLREGPNEEANKFYMLLEEGQEELFPGCKFFSKLSFTMRLFMYKCDYKLSNVQFCGMLELFKEVLPDAKPPSSFHEAHKVLKLLGLDYQKIDGCPKDCMLYWGEHANVTNCLVCGTLRWKSKDKDEKNATAHRIPQKILRYFPIKKRLHRLYMCAETARHMTWHSKG